MRGNPEKSLAHFGPGARLPKVLTTIPGPVAGIGNAFGVGGLAGILRVKGWLGGGMNRLLARGISQAGGGPISGIPRANGAIHLPETGNPSTIFWGMAPTAANPEIRKIYFIPKPVAWYPQRASLGPLGGDQFDRGWWRCHHDHFSRAMAW